jgi:predicted phosphodiesterase
MDKPKLWAILSDIHAPKEDKESFAAVLDFLQQNPVEGLVLLGDNMDCEDISRHTKQQPGLRKVGGWQKDLDYFDANILKPIEARIPKAAKRVIFYGNHEDWLQQLLEEQPELKGALSIEKSLNLIARNWKIIPQGNHYQIGKAYLVHGDQIGSSMYVAKKLVEAFCATAIMGHVHTAQMHVKTSQVKKNDKWAGYVIPTLGTVAPEYAKGRSNNHVHGLGILEEFGKDLFNVYIVIISNGRFSYGGKIYGGK